MSCASNTIHNQDPNFYQNVNGKAVPSSIPFNPNTNNGRLKATSAGYPSFAPTINNLSVTSSPINTYSLVYITGTNFLPPVYGNTYVNFGSYKQLPITFYSTGSISFVVPMDAPIGNYNVIVVNVYNSNFSPAINQSYPGNLNFSNPVCYQLFSYSVNNGTNNIVPTTLYGFINGQQNTYI